MECINDMFYVMQRLRNLIQCALTALLHQREPDVQLFVIVGTDVSVDDVR